MPVFGNSFPMRALLDPKRRGPPISGSSPCPARRHACRCFVLTGQGGREMGYWLIGLRLVPVTGELRVHTDRKRPWKPSKDCTLLGLASGDQCFDI